MHTHVWLDSKRSNKYITHTLRTKRKLLNICTFTFIMWLIHRYTLYIAIQKNRELKSHEEILSMKRNTAAEKENKTTTVTRPYILCAFFVCCVKCLHSMQMTWFLQIHNTQMAFIIIIIIIVVNEKPMMKYACVTIHLYFAFCFWPVEFVVTSHTFAKKHKPNRSLSPSASSFRFCSERIQIWPVSHSQPSIVQLYQSINSCAVIIPVLFCFTPSGWSSRSISHRFHSLDRALTQNNSEIFTVLFLCSSFIFIVLLLFFFFESFFLLSYFFLFLSVPAAINVERCSDIHQKARCARFSGRLDSTLSWITMCCEPPPNVYICILNGA